MTIIFREKKLENMTFGPMALDLFEQVPIRVASDNSHAAMLALILNLSISSPEELATYSSLVRNGDL